MIWGKNVQKQKLAWVFLQKRWQLTFPAAKISSTFRASLINIFYGNGKNCSKRERTKKRERNRKCTLNSKDLESYD